MRSALVGCVSAVLLGFPAYAADYTANLGPMPLDDETKAVIAGRGEVAATLNASRLAIEGKFRGLPSDATAALIFVSPAIGVPGKQILTLRLTGKTEGSITGTFKLDAIQAKALRTGRLYLQINSEKAPPGYTWGPKGTLWGWLLPAHPTAAANVPQQGAWFIPQLDTPSR